MSWTPKFQSRFAKPLVDNLLKIAQRDTADALLWANGGVALQSFLAYNNARRDITSLPVLIIFLLRAKPVQSDDDSYLKTDYSFACEFAIGGTNTQQLTRDLLIYTAAMDAVFRSATKADIYSGIASTIHSNSLIEVTDHIPGAQVPQASGSGFFQAMRLNLLISSVVEV